MLTLLCSASSDSVGNFQPEEFVLEHIVHVPCVGTLLWCKLKTTLLEMSVCYVLTLVYSLFTACVEAVSTPGMHHQRACNT